MKKEKITLSDADAAEIKTLAQKCANLRRYVSGLRKNLADIDKRKDEIGRRQLEIFGDGKSRFTPSQDGELSRLADEIKALNFQRDATEQYLFKGLGSATQIFARAVAIAYNFLLCKKYATAKIGAKTADKINDEAKQILAGFGEKISLWFDLGELYTSPKAGFSADWTRTVANQTGGKFDAKRENGEPIFYVPKMPACDDIDSLNCFFADVEKAEAEFMKLAENFAAWKKKYAKLLNETEGETNCYRIEATAPILKKIINGKEF